MFRRILVAYDESPEAEKAMHAAIRLAKALQAELSVISVIEPLPGFLSFATSAGPVTEWRENKRALYASRQSQAREQARTAGVWLDVELLNGDPVATIIEAARKQCADLLVLGIRKHKWRIGHIAEEITARSPCAVMGIR